MTEDVAKRLAKMIGVSARDIAEVEQAAELAHYDALIVGTPTHNTLEDKYRSGTGWDDIIDDIREVDFSGKKVAVFGLGDSNCYPEGFCDALEELHQTFQAAGASMVGYVDESGLTYEHCASKSNINGKFVGLPLDDMNEDDLTEEKLNAWIEQLKGEGMPL
jgi:flavodoxin I